VQNGFYLPASLDHYASGIPFLYPPLSFYVLGGLHAFLGFDYLTIVRFVPPILFIFSIISMYLLVFVISGSRLNAGLAAVVSAILFSGEPSLIAAPGIVRGLAWLAFILGISAAVAFYKYDYRHGRLLTGILFGVVLLSHPPTVVPYGLACFITYLSYSRSWEGFIDGAKIATIGFAILTVWLIPVLLIHGWEKFIPGLAYYFSGSTDWWNQIMTIIEGVFNTFSLTNNTIPLLRLSTGGWYLTILGTFVAIRDGEFYPIGLAAITFIIFRFYAMTLGASILISYAISDLWWQLWGAYTFQNYAKTRGTKNLQLSNNYQNIEFIRVLEKPSKIIVIVLIVGLAAGTFGMAVYSAGISIAEENPAITNNDIDAMHWIEANTAPNAKVVATTGHAAEFIPHGSNRQEPTAVWGTEWLGPRKNEFYSDIRKSINSCKNTSCLSRSLNKGDIEADYIYAKRGDTITNALQKSEEFDSVYENEGVILFQT